MNSCSKVVLSRRSQVGFYYWINQKFKRRRRISTYVFRHALFQNQGKYPNYNGLPRVPPTVAVDNAKKGLFKVLDPVSVTTCTVDVTFKVPFRVELGESLAICGNCAEFGNWTIDNALSLTWTSGNVWIGEIQLQDGTYEFKCVRVRSEGIENEWEPGENRVLVVQSSKSKVGEMEMTMDFGETRASSTIQVVRETVVMGTAGDELFRLDGGIYNLIRLEQLFQPMSNVPTPNNEEPIEEGTIHDVVSSHVMPSVTSMNQYLGSVLLFEEAEISQLHKRFPNLRFKSVELDIKPWVSFFLSKVGFSYYQVATLLKKKPSLLDYSIKDVLAPFSEFFLGDLGVLPDRFFTLLKRRPTLFNQSLSKDIKPKLKMIETLTGLEGLSLGRLVIGCNTLLAIKETEIRWRFNNLTSQLDLDVYECASLVLRFPPVLSMKPINISNKISFLTQTMRRSVNEIVGYPFCLSFSLEGRIKKRFQYLQEKDFPYQSCSLPMILSPAEHRFYSIVEREIRDQERDPNNEL